MPKGTRVHRLKTKLVRKGMPVGQAIATAQQQTGQSYKTGKAPKRKRRKK